MKIKLNNPIILLLNIGIILIIITFVMNIYSIARYKYSLMTKNNKSYKTINVSKMPEEKVEVIPVIKDIKCGDTCWINSIEVDSLNNVWIHPGTACNNEYLKYMKIKVVKLYDNTFMIDITRCDDDYVWIKDRKQKDYKEMEYYSVKQIIYKERLKK